MAHKKCKMPNCNRRARCKGKASNGGHKIGKFCNYHQSKAGKEERLKLFPPNRFPQNNELTPL